MWIYVDMELHIINDFCLLLLSLLDVDVERYINLHP